MEVKNKTVLVLGGAGLVGIAVCRELLPLCPRKMIISSLAAHEVTEATELLKRNFPDYNTEFAGIHGNLFVRSGLKDTGRQEILDDTGHRRAIIDDTLLPLTE